METTAYIFDVLPCRIRPDSYSYSHSHSHSYRRSATTPINTSTTNSTGAKL